MRRRNPVLMTPPLLLRKEQPKKRKNHQKTHQTKHEAGSSNKQARMGILTSKKDGTRHRRLQRKGRRGEDRFRGLEASGWVTTRNATKLAQEVSNEHDGKDAIR